MQSRKIVTHFVIVSVMLFHAVAVKAQDSVVLLVNAIQPSITISKKCGGFGIKIN